jgi:RNA-directed DNA polymerase
MSQYRTAHSHPLPLSSRADVAVLVGFPIKQLNYWTRVLPPELRYTVFSIPRRNSNNARVIHAPIKPIKDMQLKLAAALVPCYHPRAAVQGYVRARSILSNAKIHSRKRWVLHIDIEDFFPSINFGRVRGMFMAYPFNYTPEVATLLAQICCNANALPHGAPTSPVISNLICRGLDKDFLALASRQHCHYSRYCDDIVFSATRKPSPGALFMQDDKGLLVAGSEVTEIISNHGFRLNVEKTHLRPRTQRQMVTGLVVNRKPNVPREYIRGLRNLLYIWRKYSQEHAQARFAATQHARYRPARKPIPPLSFQWMIRGRVQYVGHIKGWTDPVYLGLAKALALVDHGFKEPRIVRTGQTAKLALYVEGPTDVLHLQAALAFFRQKGQYENLNLNFQHVNGDQQLLKHARNSSSIEHDLPIVCLFDRDKPAILKDVLGTEDDVKDWGHGVFSSAIPVPTYRKSEEPICVEMLYPDEILHLEDAEGRRLYLKSEFNQESGYHLTEEVHYIHPKRESLVAEDVYKGHQKASLSKTQFAEMVKARAAPFKLISFEGFKEIFDMLTRIYENWQSSRQRAG